MQYKTNCTKIINYKFYTHVLCKYFAVERPTAITVLTLLLYNTYIILKYVQYFSLMRK